MNIEEAKFILQAYRPGGQDANDPHFAEALDLAKKDPELARWFAGQNAFDGTMSRKLKELRTPAQLKGVILAGNRVIEPAFWTGRRVWLALAAGLVILAGVAGLLISAEHGPGFAEYSKEMIAATVIDDRHLDIKTANAAEIRAWFVSHQAEADFALPAGLRGVPSMGCRVLDWQGRKVSMLCYLLEGTRHVDLFVVSRKGMRGAPAQESPQFVQNGQVTMVTWNDNGNAYLMIGRGDEEFFRKYVAAVDFAPREAGRGRIPGMLAGL